MKIRNLLRTAMTVLVLALWVSVGWGQPWTYDFGTGTGTANNANSGSGNTAFFPSTPTDGGTYRVRIGTAGGSLVLANPGTSLGTETEAQLNAATSTATNKHGVYGWASPSTASYIKFKLRTTSTGNGNLAIALGNATIVSDNNGYTGQYNNSVANFWITYASGSISSVNRRASGSNVAITSHGFSKDTDHIVEVYANNKSTSESYSRSGTTYPLSSQSWDLWVDGIKISPENGWPKAGTLAADVNLAGFAFFAESSTSNAAFSYIDDLEYSNALPASPSNFAVNFSVDGANGTLAATVDAASITTGDNVAAGKDVAFTATPDANYRVKEWKLNTVVVSGNTTNNYTITNLQAASTVTVEFEAIPLPSVTFNVDMSNASPFNPATDDVYISGNISLEWIQPGDNATYKMSPVVPGSKIYTLTLSLTANTYEYKYFRVISGTPSWDNGEPTGGNRSVTIAANKVVDNVWGVNAHPIIGWANLQWPSSGEIDVNGTFNTYSQINIENVTTADNPYEIIKSWIGYKNTNSNPNTWAEADWKVASFNVKQGDNHEYTFNLGNAISAAGTYYYASRFQFGSGDYYYGGFQGGAWDGTTNVSGTLTVHQTYAVNFSVTGGNGAVSAKVDEVAITSGQTIRTGKNVVFTATPDGGNQVKEWKLNGVVVPDNTSNTYTLNNLSAAATVTVEYEVVPSTLYAVNFSVFNGNGSLSATVDAVGITSGNEVLEGKNVVFTATPDAGYRVKVWTLNAVLVPDNSTTSYIITNLTAVSTVTVEFEIIPQYTLTITVVGNGAVTVDAVAYTTALTLDDATVVEIIATPDAGWAFDGWTGDLVSTVATQSVTMSADKNITATFLRVPVSLVAWTFPVSGTDRVASSGVAENLTKVIAREVTYAGSYTSSGGATTQSVSSNGWDGGDGTKYWLIDFNSTGYESITLSSKQRASSNGPRDFKVQIKLNGTDWTDVPSSNVTTADNFISGVLTNVSLPAIVNNQGQVYLRWVMTSNISVGGGAVLNTGTSRIDDIEIKGLTLSGGIQRTLVLAKTGTGTITPQAGTYAYNDGTQITLTAAPQAGWEFTGWSGDLTSTDLSVGVTMDADKTITATFIEDLPEYAVSFNVDMAAAIAKELFNPATEQVYVVGNFTADWAGSLELTKVGETSIYAATTAAVFNAGNALEFKFRVGATEWEVGANRNYTVIDGANEINATFNTPQITWANLQYPETGSIDIGSDTYNAYAQVYIQDITGVGAAGSINGLNVWIGVNATNATETGDFATGWTWIPATLTAYEAGFGNNSQYVANLASVITEPGTYYYVSRFQYGNDALVYGGYNTGYWDGSDTKKSGILTVNITDAYKVAQDKNALDYGDFSFNGAENQNNVKSNFGLPGVGEMHLSAITWLSGDTDIITIVANGANWTAQVTRPLPSGGKGDATVTLTATINSNGTTDTKEFSVIVKEDLSSFIAALSSGGNKTSGVAFGVSLSSAKDVDGNLISGDKTVIISSNKDGEVFNDVKTFAAGATSISITLNVVDTHLLTINVAGVTESETLEVVVEAAPTFSVSISHGGNSVEGTYSFETKVQGYAPVTAETFTITRTGDGDITGLAVALSGMHADSFTATAVVLTTLDTDNASTTFTVKPNDGLATGFYSAQVDVTADNDVEESFTISFEVIAATYTIDLSVSEIDFGTSLTGYEPIAVQMVTITKTGNSNIANLLVALSGYNADSFVITQPLSTTLVGNGASTTFTVKPADGLTYGTYSAIVTVTADNDVIESFTVSFTVISYQISLNAVNPTVFESQYAGYEPVTEETITITRMANGNVTGLTVGLSGANAASFTVTQPILTALDNDNSITSFTVKPNNGLAVGQYAATVSVTANNGISETFGVEFEVLQPLSTAANITAFSFAQQTGAATIGDGTIAIEVAHGTDRSNLVATFSLSAGASAKIGATVQESGVTVNDFTNVVTYVVTAEDGTTTKNWDVTVTEAVLDLSVVIFTESVGTVGGTTTLAAHEAANGFDNDQYTMTQGSAANPADIRATTPSTGYAGASGGANVWFTTTNGEYGFAIEGINASSYTNLKLQFGYAKTSATVLPTFVFDYWNGSSYVNVPFTFNEAANAPIAWYLSPEISLPSGAQISNLRLRWVKTGTIGIRIDDVVLKGVAAPKYAVNFNVSGSNGNLSTTVDGTDITTGEEVEEGKNVVFSAVPDNGYRVKEWKLNNAVVDGNTTNTYTLENLTAEATVTVEFEEIPPVLYAVTFDVTGENGALEATVDGNPIVSGTEVEEGSTVVFTAIPAEGYRVKEWTLNNEVVVENTTITYTLGNLAATANVTVEFELIPATTYAVTFSVISENGTLTAKANGVAIESGNAVYEGDDVVFTALASAGFRVKEWTLNTEVVVGNTTNTFTIQNIAAIANVTVEFEAIPQFTLTVSVVGNGDVTVNGTAYTEAVSFYEGTVANIVATPEAGWQFDSWTGPVAEALEATTTVTMDADKTITATFTEIPVVYYTVNYSVVNGNGSLAATVSGNPVDNGAQVEEGSNVDFVATPADGYRVKEWKLNNATVVGNTTNNYAINNLSGNATVTVEFELIPLGTLLLSENFDYTQGTFLTANGWTAHSGAGTTPITVVSPGLEFAGYIGSGIGNAAAVSNTGEDVHRTFPEQTSGAIYAAFIVKTEATNAEGYFFNLGQTTIGTNFFSRVWVNASGSALGLGTYGTGLVPTNYVSITPGTPTLVVLKHDFASKVSGLFVFNSFPTTEPGVANATFTETATFTNIGSIALRQYNAAQRIVVDGIRVATSWSEAVKSSAVVPTYAVNFSVIGTGGNLAAKVDGANILNGALVNQGKNVVFTAVPDNGYRVKEWKLNNAVVNGNTTNTYTLENLTAEATVTVDFEEIPPVLYAVTFDVTGENGTLEATVDGNPIVSGTEVEEGSTVVFTAIPAEGYRVKEWTLNNEVVVENTTITYTLANLAATANVTVEFELIPATTYAVTFSVVSENGTLTAKANGVAIESGDAVYEGDDVVFTALASAGFRIKEWTLNTEVVVGNTTNTFTIQDIAAVATVTVEFEAIPQYTLTISVVGNGDVTVDGTAYTEAVSFYENEVANIVATPEAGWQFDSWTGSVANALEATTTVTMDADKTITATFTEIPVVYYTVNYSVVNGNGNLAATVSGNPIDNGAQVEEGSNVAFVATPNNGYRVKEWKLNNATVIGNTTNNYAINNLAGNATVTVEFELIPSGTLLLSENFDYTQGTFLTANGWTAHSGAGTTPITVVSPGLEFAGYIGSGIGNAAAVSNTGEDVHRTFPEQTSGAIYTAFIVKTEATNAEGYFLNLGQTTIGTNFFSRVWVNATGSALGLGTYGTGLVPTNYVSITPGTPTLVVLKHDFASKVSGLFVFNSFPTTEPGVANATFTETATFTNIGSIALRQYNAAQRIVVDGIRVATSWSEAVKSSTVIPTYAVNFSVIGTGGNLAAKVDGANILNGALVNQGKNVVFTAVPDNGYRVKEWKLNNAVVDGNTTNNYTLENLTAEATVTVEFEEIPPVLYAVTFDVTGENGTLEATVDGNPIVSGTEVEEGSTVVFTAIPAEGYRVKEWTLNSTVVVGNTSNLYSLENLSAAADVSVEFEQLPENTYVVTFEVVNGNGSITAKVNGVIITSGDAVYEGDDVMFTASPNAGFRVKEWTLNTVVVAGNTTNTFTIQNIAAVANVTVEFEAIPQYTLTVNTSGNGVVTVNGTLYTSAVTFTEGVIVSIVASPNAGWQFDSWTGSVANALEATTTVTMNADKTITATFTEIPVVYYTVNYSVVNGNGNLAATVSGNPVDNGAQVQEGSAVSFVATPNNGYRVKEWKLNNATVVGNTTNNYAITSLSGNVTVSVEFEIIPASQDLLLTENFDYVEGSLLTTNGWTAHSAGINPQTVVAPGLTYPNYVASGIGLAASSVKTGEDVSKSFNAQTTGAVYTAFMANFSDAGTVEAGDYFFHYMTDATTNFRGRIYIKKHTTEPKLAFGVTRGANGASATWTGFNYDLNTTYLMVLKYQFVDGDANDLVSLFINPQIGASEPAALVVNGTETQSDFSVTQTLNAIALRQGGSTTGSIQTIDGIRVAKTWQEAVKGTGTVVYHDVNYAVNGVGGTLQASANGLPINTNSQVLEGSDVLFTANPFAGFRVSEWTVNNTVVPENTSNTLLMANLQSDIDVAVSFSAIPQYTATITIVGNGSVHVNGALLTGPITVYEGTELNLEAAAATNWAFEGWTGDYVSANATETIVVNSNMNITATFSDQTVYHSVNFAAGDNGTLGATVGGNNIVSGQEIAAGSDVTFTAIPAEGYRVKSWKVNNVLVVGNTSNQLMVTALAENIDVFVEFELLPENQYNVTFSVVNGNGAVNATVDGIMISSGDLVYEGENVTFTAIPDFGFRVKQWTYNSEVVQGNTTNTFVLATLMTAATVTVEFEAIPQYSLEILIVGNGTVNVGGTPYTTTMWFYEGTNVSLQAVAQSGWLFSAWSGGISSVNANETVLMNGNKTITATFIEVQTDVTIAGWNFDDQNAIADLGIAQNLDRIMEVNTGGTISYVAGVGTSSFAMSSNLWTDGSGVKAWYTSFTTTGYQGIKLSSVQRSSSTGPRDFKVQYRIAGMSWTDVPGAVVTAADNFTSGALNNTQLPALCNNQGVVYLRWIMTSNTSVSESTVVNAGTSRIDNVIIKGSTLPGAVQHTLVLSKTGLGTIEPVAGTYVFNYGTPVTLQATPQAGQVFDGWVGDFNSTNLTDVVTMDGNKTITAMFRPFMSASINPTSGDFYEDEPENLTTVITWNDASMVTSIVASAFGEQFPLEEGLDYIITDIDGETALLTFLMVEEKFAGKATKEMEAILCEISFDAGVSSVYTINYYWYEMYYVLFNVTSSGSPVVDAEINIDGETVFTDSYGQVELILIDGSYPFTIAKDGYVTYEGTVVVNGNDQTVNVNLISGIADISATLTRFFPNPVVDVITLERQSSDKVNLEIYSVNGSLVYAQEWSTERLNLNLNDLKTGLFTIRLTGNGKVETLRFIKQ